MVFILGWEVGKSCSNSTELDPDRNRTQQQCVSFCVCLCCFYNPLLSYECTQDKNGPLCFFSAVTLIKQREEYRSGVGQDSQNGRPCMCKGKPRLQNGLHYKQHCKYTAVYCRSCLLFKTIKKSSGLLWLY